MSSAVLVIIVVPHKDHENDIKEKEKLCDTLKKRQNGTNKSELHTINEAPNENFNEYHTKVDNIKELPIETVVDDALSYLGIIEATWTKSKNGNYYQVTFSVDLEDSDAVIQYFKSRGVGNKVGSSIGIIPFSHFCYDEGYDELEDIELITYEENGKQTANRTLSGFKAAQSKFLKSITARLTVAQVVDNVKSGASLTFDFVCYLTFASWIAAMGLLDNSVISLVASMLVSPMMGPVMAMTFGTIIRDGSLRALGFRNLGVCFAITILFGYFFGLIALNFTEHWNSDQVWPTNMMRERGLPRVAWVGTLVAFPSGCAVAISLLSGNEASLVGVAISVSLLPPAVNTGLLWAFATLRTLYAIGEDPTNTTVLIDGVNRTYVDLPPSLTPADNYYPYYFDNLALETACLGCLSLVLSLVNITNIFIGALILLKIKEIAPLSTMSPTARRFFQEDIKIAREYNARSDNDANMGESVLKEWADIAGLDVNHLLSDKPEARVTQIQTLTDIARDVEADQVYQSVTRHRLSTTNLVRRLSQGVYQPALNNSTLNLSSDGRRRSSIRSINIPNILVSDVESGAIANRRRSNRRSSRLSQVTANLIPMEVRRDMGTEEYDRFARPSSPTAKIPHSAGVLPSNAAVFNFGDNLALNDMNRQMASTDRQRRRRSSALLRRSLQTSEHSPYSVWPSARISPATTPRFVVTPVNETSNERYCSIPEISVEERQ